jgi:hypothetical protein
MSQSYLLYFKVKSRNGMTKKNTPNHEKILILSHNHASRPKSSVFSAQIAFDTHYQLDYFYSSLSAPRSSVHGLENCVLRRSFASKNDEVVYLVPTRPMLEMWSSNSYSLDHARKECLLAVVSVGNGGFLIEMISYVSSETSLDKTAELRQNVHSTFRTSAARMKLLLIRNLGGKDLKDCIRPSNGRVISIV